ncbi:hypothetical protein NJLHNGOC_08785 [Novacetimonas cocois]|uniref:Uncharacterized protein n=1 Tax=Novacetimonas cocois TaxID=1747507 RepID=A0A365YWT9_9PROT|nr:hypothetical protein NJLHNGOC_08785 [Novacetimonas cocois]
MKLFAKSFERRHLFEKRRHPKTFIHIRRLFRSPRSWRGMARLHLLAHARLFPLEMRPVAGIGVLAPLHRAAFFRAPFRAGGVRVLQLGRGAVHVRAGRAVGGGPGGP